MLSVIFHKEKLTCYPPVSGYLSAHKPEHSNQSRGRTIPLLELIYEPADDLVLDYKY